MPRSRMLLGILLSFAVNLLLVRILMGSLTPEAVLRVDESHPTMVRIIVPEPVLPVEPAPLEATAPTPEQVPPEASSSPPRKHGKKRPLADQPAITADTTPPAEEGPPEEQTPHFDVENAKRLARGLVHDPGVTKRDAPVAQLAQAETNRMSPNERLRRHVEQAVRSDCKDTIANTGLFALIIIPITIVRDMHDTGCKW